MFQSVWSDRLAFVLEGPMEGEGVLSCLVKREANLRSIMWVSHSKMLAGLNQDEEERSGGDCCLGVSTFNIGETLTRSHGFVVISRVVRKPVASALGSATAPCGFQKSTSST